MQTEALDTEGYYKTLGVPKNATSGQIKKAFNALALRWHPDKNPNADPKIFIGIQTAYEVLENSEKRGIYDQYGEMGLQAHQMYGGKIPEELRAIGFTMITCVLCWAFLLMLLFVIFVSLRADNKLHWSWSAVFGPAWVFDAIGLLIVAMNVKKPEDGEAGEVKFVVFSLKALVFVSLVVFQFLVMLKLEEKIATLWLYVFVPLFAAEGLMVFSKIRSFIAMCKKTQTITVTKVFRTFRWTVAFVTFTALLVARLNNTIDWSWTWVFFPLYFSFAFFWLVDFILEYMLVSTVEEKQLKKLIVFKNLATLFCYGILFAFFGLMVIHLNTGAVSVVMACVPILVVLGLCCCCCCMGAMLATVSSVNSSNHSANQSSSNYYSAEGETNPLLDSPPSAATSRETSQDSKSKKEVHVTVLDANDMD